MMRAVEDVLEEIGAGDRPRLLVLNKADAIDPERRRELTFRHPDGIIISAATGEGLDELGRRVEAAFAATLLDVDLLVPYSDGALPELHALAGDLERRETADGVRVSARLPAPWPSASRASASTVADAQRGPKTRGVGPPGKRAAKETPIGDLRPKLRGLALMRA